MHGLLIIINKVEGEFIVCARIEGTVHIMNNIPCSGISDGKAKLVVRIIEQNAIYENPESKLAG